MSTRSIIARATGEGTFKGVYHHWDGYPTGLGKYLTEIFAGPFANDLPRMLRTLIDEHPAGWSTMVHKDFIYEAGAGVKIWFGTDRCERVRVGCAARVLA